MKYLKNKINAIANFMYCVGKVKTLTSIAIAELSLAIVMVVINPWLAIASAMLLFDTLLFVCAYCKYRGMGVVYD